MLKLPIFVFSFTFITFTKMFGFFGNSLSSGGFPSPGPTSPTPGDAAPMISARWCMTLILSSLLLNYLGSSLLNLKNLNW